MMSIISTLGRCLFAAIQAVRQPVADHQRLWHHIQMPLLTLAVHYMLRRPPASTAWS
jgi:hypothetical protein